MKTISKLSKVQKFRLKQIMAKDRYAAAKYLRTFNKGNRYTHSYEARLEKAKFPQLSNSRYSLGRGTGSEELIQARREISRKGNFLTEHKPPFPPKFRRYFGVEIECFVPSEFGSGGREECGNCSGEGEVDVDCYHCDGRGKVDCSRCEGTGEIPCEYCDGEGYVDGESDERVECSHCNAKGMIPCESCDGKGEVECSRCDGSGYKRETCGECDGSGQIETREGFDGLADFLDEKGITYVHLQSDGSLSSDWGDYIPVEISILVDQRNPDNLRRLTDALKEIKAKVNRTCGLHVHLDFRHLQGEEHSEEFKTRVMALGAAMNVLRYAVPESRLNNQYCRQGYSFSDKYREVNASPFSYSGTVEVRLHSGTTEFDKIHNWTQVLASIAYSSLISVGSSYAVYTLNALRSTFGVPQDLCEYIASRIETFHENHEALDGFEYVNPSQTEIQLQA